VSGSGGYRFDVPDPALCALGGRPGRATVGRALLGFRWALAACTDETSQNLQALALLIMASGEEGAAFGECPVESCTGFPTPLVPSEEEPVGVVRSTLGSLEIGHSSQ
jgi:hypothetical protein